MKRLLLIGLVFLFACKKEASQPAPVMVDVIYEIESNTNDPIEAHFGKYYNTNGSMGSTMISWIVATKGIHTQTASYPVGTVSAEGDATCATSGDWTYRIKTKSGKVLQEHKGTIQRNGGLEYYNVIMSVMPQ